MKNPWHYKLSYIGGLIMYIYPGKEKFSKEELLSYFEQIIDNISSKKEPIVYNILCILEKLRGGVKIQLRRYESINENNYILIDISIIKPPGNRWSISDTTCTPLIVDPKSDRFDMIYGILTSYILTIQDECLKIRDTMIVSSAINSGRDRTNEELFETGIIENVLDPFDEVFEKTIFLNTRYMELEFILDEPRTTHKMYLHVIRDKYINLTYYIINIEESMCSKIATDVDTLRFTFNEYLSKVYNKFRHLSKQAAVKIEYYNISEIKELI